MPSMPANRGLTPKSRQGRKSFQKFTYPFIDGFSFCRHSRVPTPADGAALINQNRVGNPMHDVGFLRVGEILAIFPAGLKVWHFVPSASRDMCSEFIELVIGAETEQHNVVDPSGRHPSGEVRELLHRWLTWPARRRPELKQNDFASIV